MIAAAARLRTPFLRFSVALHGVGLVVLLLFPRLWPWIAGTLFADHLVGLVGCVLPRSRLVGPNTRRVPAGGAAPFVVLTFDDGPDPDVTPVVLDMLEQHRALATFFCIGERVERHPELARDIVARGHRIENHSQHHANLFSFLGPRALTRELTRAQETIAACTGRAPVFFRAPAGVRSPWADWVLAGIGLQLVSWTRRAFDTIDENPERVVRRLLRDLASGDVLVMHDSGSAQASGEPVVLRALPLLLAELDRHGLRATHLCATANGPAAARPVSA